MSELNLDGLVNKPPIDEICHLDLVNKPDIMDEDSLYHHGILHMRWGIRRYQNPDGSLTELGKRRLYEKRTRREKKIEDRINKAKRREAKKKERFEKRKRKILEDPALIMKYKDKLSTKEIQAAVEKLRALDDIGKMNTAKIQRGKDMADKILSLGETANSAINFLNSNAGKAIRQQLGFGTDDIFKFNKKSELDEINKQINLLKAKNQLAKLQNGSDAELDLLKSQTSVLLEKEKLRQYQAGNFNYNNNKNNSNGNKLVVKKRGGKRTWTLKRRK